MIIVSFLTITDTITVDVVRKLLLLMNKLTELGGQWFLRLIGAENGANMSEKTETTKEDIKIVIEFIALAYNFSETQKSLEAFNAAHRVQEFLLEKGLIK